MRIILPFLILGLAAAVFFYFTAPLVDQIDALKIQKAKLAVALDHANKLKERQDELAAIYNGIDPADEKNLEEFLPNNIDRSEEHTSELQSQFHLVCRLLLEK